MRAEGRPVKRSFGSISSDVRGEKPYPFLKWAGGKTQLLKQMTPFFPSEYNTYFEPFLGGGAVFFHLLPERAVLSDSNSELMHVYRIVRDKPEELMKALDEHFPSRKNEDYFYRVRSQDPKNLNNVQKAARTIFLNKTCFNGLYRVNSRGQFNVPFGQYENPSMYDRQNMLNASMALRRATLKKGDYRRVIKQARKGDFVYFDPPYQPSSKTASFTAYTKDAFGEDNQRELAELFGRLDEQGCKVMLSNSSTPLIHSMYKGYTIKRLKAARAISCKADGRGKIDEVLILNYG